MTFVPKAIDNDEPCVRCIMHPFGYKKGRIQKEALLPPPQKTDVSMLRLRYTTTKFCINHGRSLQSDVSTFRCLATLTLQDVKEANLSSSEDDTLITSNIVYGPMHKGEYVLNKDVYINDPDVDLPMHADLRYNIPYPHPKGGEVATRMRKYAHGLAQKMKPIYMEEAETSA